jgi:hypothetical protein
VIPEPMRNLRRVRWETGARAISGSGSVAIRAAGLGRSTDIVHDTGLGLERASWLLGAGCRLLAKCLLTLVIGCWLAISGCSGFVNRL